MTAGAGAGGSGVHAAAGEPPSWMPAVDLMTNPLPACILVQAPIRTRATT